MIEIMRWHKHQHYHSRKYPPLWIKVFPKLLDDPLYMGMTTSAQLLLLKLWMMTSQAKAEGNLPMNIIDIAWRLRMEETDCYPLIMELAAVKDEDGQSQWLVWTETPLDAVLKQRLDYEHGGSRPSLEVGADVLEVDDSDEIEAKEEKNHLAALAAQRNPELMRVNEVGLDLSPTTYNENENESNGDDDSLDDGSDVPHETETEDEPRPLPVIPPIAPETAAKYGTWLTKYAEPWEARFGAGSFPYGRAARPMKQLEAAHSKQIVEKHWEFYCQVEPEEYANPQSFQMKFAAYDPDNQTRSTLTPHAS